MTTQVSPPERAAARATVEEFMAALGARDADRMTACFADDAEHVIDAGTFVGRAHIGRYFRWFTSTVTSISLQEAGLGTVVTDGTAVVEHAQTATTRTGMTWTSPVARLFELDEDGKIRRSRTYYDRWHVFSEGAHQAGGLTGVVSRAFVARAERAMTEGMPRPDRAPAGT